MDRPTYAMQKGESLAARRTITIPMYASADYVTPGTVVAGKATLSLNGAAIAYSTNSMSAVSGVTGMAYLELTAAELSDYGDLVVSANMGSSFGQAIVRITRFDPFTQGATTERGARLQAGMR